VKFLRQFAAVLLVVAAVTALGVAWAHSSESDWIFHPPPPPPGIGGPGQVPSGHGAGPSDPRVITLRPGAKLPAGARKGGIRFVSAGGGAPFDPSDSANVISTAEIEGAVIAGIVVLDLIRRRYRRAKRARQLAALD